MILADYTRDHDKSQSTPKTRYSVYERICKLSVKFNYAHEVVFFSIKLFQEV